MICGPHRGLVRSVPRAGLLLGRSGAPAEGEALLLEDPWISRRQALVTGPCDDWRLRDLGGRNRAFVDGKAVPPDGEVALADGALLRLGDTLLLLRHGALPQETSSERCLRAFPGHAPAAFAVRRRLHQLQRTSGPVLILGETGTGKERAARAIAAPQQPVVPQNCAELTRELARSELFGHVRGAFSGALASKAGLVEAAEHGVLFLDEVGELSLDVQAELLRFLEDGHYRPVGATELRASSARVVAATNVDLDAAVRAGRFRRDLLARLRAANPPLALPPLRERREDVLEWAECFQHELSGAEPPAPLAPWNAGAAECLLLYLWPGNLRDLRGVIRGLAQAGIELSTLRSDDLPQELREHRRALRGVTEPVPVLTEPAKAASEASPAQAAPLPPTRESIEALLSSTSGSIRATAHQLGVDRRKLYRLCERLGIDLDSYRANPEQEDRDG